MANDFKKHQFKAILVAVLVMGLTFAMQMDNRISFLIRTSVLGFPEHEAFDGTTAPIQKVPNWVKLSSDKWDADYNSLSSSDLVNLPFYDPAELKTSTDSLTWGDAEDDAVRVAKITYSVPYMGTYLLDGLENSGSHPAVDIKIPEDTPIYAMANGTVIKTSTQSSGFGHHIVIQHNNFPSLNDKDDKETIYSSYSHLNDVLVEDGDVVTKGQQIATSGETGTATTPHLHFQIDNDYAPWHPFWPFSWSEISEAGLDFFSAINEGFGQDKAKETTINPMKYVQKYDDDDTVYSDYEDDAENDDNSTSSDTADSDVSASSYVNKDSEKDSAESSDVEKDGEVDEDEDANEEDPVEVVPKDPPELSFVIEVKDQYYTDQPATFIVKRYDQYGEVFEGSFEHDISVKSDKNLSTSSLGIIRYVDFDKDGLIVGELENAKPGKDRLKIKYDDEYYYSEWFEIVEGGGTAFNDLPSDHKYYEAVSYLVNEKVVAGYPDGTFKPDQTVSRVEALKFIFEGIKSALAEGSLPFPDTSEKEWYGKYLYTAYKNGVVDGYPDGTFKPTNTVNHAEFFKILFNGMGVDVNPVVEMRPFIDVEKDQWFAPYAAYAKELGIVEGSYFKPADGMSRGEVADAIYRLMLKMK